MLIKLKNKKATIKTQFACKNSTINSINSTNDSCYYKTIISNTDLADRRVTPRACGAPRQCQRNQVSKNRSSTIA
jgi:hypothetical protein